MYLLAKRHMKLSVLTYNISWATQLKTPAGSEADFVNECIRHNRECFENAIHMLEGVEPLHVAGFQEVELPDVAQRVQSSQPGLNTWFRGCVWNTSVSKCVSVLTMWNEDMLGKMIWHCVFDLDEENGGRPCSLVLTKTPAGQNILLINAQFPWISKEEQITKVERVITSHCPRRNFTPIFMGDTNDCSTYINSSRPLQIAGWPLSQGMDRKELRRRLITCCWHEPGHRHPTFTDTGDYILALSVQRQRIPSHFYEARRRAIASDHLPVVATVNVRYTK